MSKETCPYCGANPVVHSLAWFDQNLTILLGPFFNATSNSAFMQFMYQLVDQLLAGFIWLLETIRLVHFNTDPLKTPVMRGRVLWQEAQARGIRMENLMAFGQHSDLYRAWINGKRRYFVSLPRPRSAEDKTPDWIDDKALLKQHLQKAAVPVPTGACVTSFRQAQEVFARLNKPVIIKPRIGSRGRHTTTFINTEKQLAHGFVVAKQLCHWVIIEEHLVGSVYRGTVIGGKLVGVLQGDPPRLTGDGIHTIAELLDMKNNSRPAGVLEIKSSRGMENFLLRSGHVLSTVLPAGKIIDISEKIGVSYGGSSREVTKLAHPEFTYALEQAAGVINDPILGFDFITVDIERSPNEQRWGIIECNGAPFINLHHFPLFGEPNNIARHVWDLFEPDRGPVL